MFRESESPSQIVVQSPSDIVSIAESGDVYRLHLIGGQSFFVSCEEDLEPSHPSHVEGSLLHFRYLYLASRNNLSPTIGIAFCLHSSSETESDQEGVGAVLMLLERVDVAYHTEETSLTFILDAVSPMGFTAGIAEFDGVKLNVVSDGEYLPEGAQVRVDRVDGNRIVVRQI